MFVYQSACLCPALAALLMALPCAQAAAAVYKCKDDAGGISYSEIPCKGEAMPMEGGTMSVLPMPTLTPLTPLAPEQPRIETPKPTPWPQTPTKRPVDPDAPMVENCSVDNPDYDPEFCTPANLNNVYGPAGGTGKPRKRLRR
ncbi:hypothetical protein IGB42_03435 [Andreprevotia sp. IGB-42]|uniref:DUF4124 domain-containing protein n=1 Tax=Andreprevotia sp. IGB-42 TaxID=2497473 RepID=UPI0013581C29|nr:DUF4124 domain-containing protein [Andreprevotia sp. IGB-42]KAF0812157.1 hypothetical protein IGB42_03435 [Andreprevotia sp. IGB-42]